MKTTLRQAQRRLWWIIIFCCLTIFANAQPKQGQDLIDSLLTVLSTAKEDTNKVNVLSKLSDEYNIVNPAEGIRFGNEALELSQRLNWLNGERAARQALTNNYVAQNDYSTALEHTLKAIKIAERANDIYNVAVSDVSLGVIYLRMKDTTKSLSSYNDALNAFKKLKDGRGQAFVYNNLANIYDEQKKRDEALDNYNKALEMFEQSGNRYGIAMVTVNMGTVYQAKGEYTIALQYFFKSLDEYKRLGATAGIAINMNNIGEVYMKIAGDTSGLSVADSLRDKKSLLTKAESYSLQAYNLGKEMEAFDIMFNTTDHLSTIKELQGNPIEALKYFRQSVAYRDSVYSEENKQKFEELAKQREEDLKLKQIEVQKLQLDKAKQRQTFLIIGLVGLLMVAGLIFYQNTRVRKERNRSDSLLRNILPEETAAELKQNGHAAARQYDNVSVLFTDFKDFTKLAAHLSPTELVAEIDFYYKAFDNIIGKYNIEKIKTIGDAYMAAGGLPVEDHDNAYRVVKAGLEIREFVNNERQKRLGENKPLFEIRIGINTGPVVAGIVGVKKFAYDIWGDTVNLASRMESSGEPGKVNISGSTYGLVKNKFECTYRGKVLAKNKGEVEMYFVENEIS